MTWLDFISNLGGVCGLCLGISFISITELVYWFAFRLFKRVLGSANWFEMLTKSNQHDIWFWVLLLFHRDLHKQNTSLRSSMYRIFFWRPPPPISIFDFNISFVATKINFAITCSYPLWAWQHNNAKVVISFESVFYKVKDEIQNVNLHWKCCLKNVSLVLKIKFIFDQIRIY